MKERVLLVKIDKNFGGPQRLSFSEPIGICYISSFLQENGIECQLLHVIQDNARYEISESIKSFEPTMVGFSVRNFNFNITCACIEDVRSHLPHVAVCIGGECVTWENASSLAKASNADVALVSDGEKSLLAYLSGKNPASIPGIAYRSSSGQFVSSAIAPERVDPSILPMMDRDGLPMKSYSSEAFLGKKYATMHVQRGCRYRCTFCHSGCRYDGPASRKNTQIIEEIDFLSDKYQIEALAIFDEDFFSDFSRVQSIAESLIDRGSPVEWHTFMKLTDLQNQNIKKLLPLLRRSGYQRAIIGLESFIPKSLKHYHKVSGANSVESNLQYLSEHGIKVCPTYIIGQPDETEKEVEYGLEHLLMLRDRGIDIDLPYITFLTPFPGTVLFEEYLRKELIIDDNWDHYDTEHVVVKSKCAPDRLVELRDDFYRDFYI